jgi:hypothetical protein
MVEARLVDQERKRSGDFLERVDRNSVDVRADRYLVFKLAEDDLPLLAVDRLAREGNRIRRGRRRVGIDRAGGADRNCGGEGGGDRAEDKDAVRVDSGCRVRSLLRVRFSRGLLR